MENCLIKNEKVRKYFIVFMCDFEQEKRAIIRSNFLIVGGRNLF